MNVWSLGAKPLRLLMVLLGTVAALALMAAPLPAEGWSVGHGKGIGCFKYKASSKLKKGGKFCHNCTTEGGQEVRWEFDILCGNEATGKKMVVLLDCNSKGGQANETGQLKALQEEAEKKLPKKNKACPSKKKKK